MPEDTPTDNQPDDQLVRLTAAEARVLGALIEKEVTTPDYYPLSLNALGNACNQRSNREPVMNLDEDDLRQALHALERKQLAGRARSSDGRVSKYEHWLGEAFNFTRAETALMCVLLLRGPQTPGELRGRTERLHQFDEISDVLAGLQKLMERSPALAAILPRLPGTKEARYAHLLCGPVESVPIPASAAEFPASNPAHEERIALLEAAVEEMRQQMASFAEKLERLIG
ncbi:MAG TPA: YceH family protein [Terracidiphilus sp.]|nr:YceH family protein [Terracidiphilus sp.]